MTIDGRRRLVIAALLCFALAMAAVVTVFVQSLARPVAAQPEGPRYTPASDATPPPPAAPGQPLVALTFDDGPTPERTPWVLDVLRAKGVRATFFLQADNAERYPDLVRRIRDEGHVIGNHSYSHPYFPDLTPQAAEEDIVRANRVLEQITGVRPVLFRYPFGQSSAGGDAALAREGLTRGVLWHWASGLPGDFECPGSAGMANLVLTEATDQALILLHDASDVLRCPPEQWDYLPSVIDELRARGFGFGIVVPADRPSELNQGSFVAVVPR